jgi:hypothetical protein
VKNRGRKEKQKHDAVIEGKDAESSTNVKIPSTMKIVAAVKQNPSNQEA